MVPTERSVAATVPQVATIHPTAKYAGPAKLHISKGGDFNKLLMYPTVRIRPILLSLISEDP